MTNVARNRVRIPNLPLGPLVDSQGNATGEEKTFRQSLLTLLEQIAGNEGLVMPSQLSADVTKIQNNEIVTDGATPNTSYSCQFGTMLYSVGAAPIDDEVVVAVNSGSLDNKPIFKEILLADDQTLYPGAGAIAGYLLTTYGGTQYKIALYALS